MLYSMTGYGERDVNIDGIVLSATIQTLNNKGLDIHIDLPPTLYKHMLALRRLLSSKLKRGRVDLVIKCHLVSKTNTPFDVAQDTIKKWYQALFSLAQTLDAKTDILNLVVSYWLRHNHHLLLNHVQEKQINQLVSDALEDCIRSRAKEGNYLAKQLQNCLMLLQDNIQKIQAQVPIRMTKLKERLEEKIKTREGTVDKPRWEQEVLYYLEKIDIEEEITRFKSHIAYFESTISKGEVVGKKLGFILQEMLREVNTIAAKAQDVTLQHLAVEMKHTLEQMKEQVRNLL